ncbi:hypothetical protein [Helicobacter sp. L8]|uniref:hypothetical protein n=1 Tax=Helicobacter sp. L8 TaxID=2316078 RepID=UPI000EB57530|nr:hypothetical protein [Helicobacter sp. L8]
MKTNRFKSGILKSKFIPKFLGIGLLVAMPCILSAENSGFYGSVGFQYSNMTKAVGSNNLSGAPIATEMANPFLNAGSSSTTPVGIPTLTGPNGMFTPNSGAKMNVSPISQP